MQEAQDQVQWTGAVSAMRTSQPGVLVSLHEILRAEYIYIDCYGILIGRYAPNCCNNNFKDSECVGSAPYFDWLLTAIAAQIGNSGP